MRQCDHRSFPDKIDAMLQVDSFSRFPDMVPAFVEIAWSEWGNTLTEEEHERWLRLAADDARLHSWCSAGFVAFEGGTPIGVVQLHEFDIEEMHDRSPWVCGMVVKPEYRGSGIGRRLLHGLESFAADQGVERLWVFTGVPKGFYERCGWSTFADVTRNGEQGTVLTKYLEGHRDRLRTTRQWSPGPRGEPCAPGGWRLSRAPKRGRRRRTGARSVARRRR
jgi:GNAT superfamily N-acetyltransferase